MAWSHPTKFRHYLQKYPQGSTSFEQIDIEETFRCRYVSLENTEYPSAKTVYLEDYAEHNGKRVYASSDTAYNASDLTLTLRWKQEECEDVQEWSDKFFQYISSQKFEYHDTLRPDKYWQFILQESPTIKYERLYGNQQYRFVSYKLTNFGGKPYKTSQL